MNIVDLDDSPTFDALSYTWGNPVTIYQTRDEASLLPDVDEIIQQTPNAGASETGAERSLVLDLDAYLYRSRHPYIPYEKLDWNAERCHSINCDDQKILVAKNLWDALNFFRRLVVGDVKCPPNFFESMCGNPVAEHIWIDAICINQEDIQERNSQVAIMDRIFGSARTVICWLGPEETMSREAIYNLSRMSVNIMDPTNKWYGDKGSLYLFEYVAEKEWLAIFAFFQRLWFRRIWIVQEAVLANRLLLVCGGVLLQWSVLSTTLEFLEKHKLDEKIEDLVKNLMAGGAVTKFAKDIETAGIMIAGTRGMKPATSHPFKVSPKAIYDFVAGVDRLRRWMGKDVLQISLGDSVGKSFIHPLTNLFARGVNKLKHLTGKVVKQHSLTDAAASSVYNISNRLILEKGTARLKGKVAMLYGATGERQEVTLEQLLTMFRQCSSSDPRDKIFGLLGILSASNPPLITDENFRFIEPNYNLAVQDVYINATKYVLRGARDLRILSHVQDPALSKITGLPSWVPDFSIDQKATMLVAERDGQQPFFADRTSHETNELYRHIDMNLKVWGVRVDRIIYVAGPKGCYFVRTASVVSGLPVQYKPAADTASGLDADGAKGERTNQPTLNYGRTDASEACKRSVTRVEAYWRTLVADCFQGEHPASLECGFAFSDWICLHLQRARNLTYMAQKFGGVGAVENPTEKYDKKLAAWKALDSGEKGRFYTEYEVQQMSNRLPKTANLINVGEHQINVDNGVLRYLPDEARFGAFERAYANEEAPRHGESWTDETRVQLPDL